MCAPQVTNSERCSCSPTFEVEGIELLRVGSGGGGGGQEFEGNMGKGYHEAESFSCYACHVNLSQRVRCCDSKL